MTIGILVLVMSLVAFAAIMHRNMETKGGGL